MPEPPVALSEKRADALRSAPATAGPVEVRWFGAPVPLPEGFLEPGYRPEGPRSRLGRRGAVHQRWPDGREVFHRDYSHGGLCRFVLGGRYTSPRRLERELEAAARLRAAGVPTAEPVCGRVERGLLGCRLALVTTRLEGRTLHDHLEDGADAGVLAAVGRSLARLHEVGFRHRDLHAGNLVVGPDGTVAVLDLEGGSWGGGRGDDRARQSLVRMARHHEKHLGRRPALRLVAAVLRGYEPDPRARRLLLRDLVRRYRRSLPWHRLLWGRSPL